MSSWLHIVKLKDGAALIATSSKKTTFCQGRVGEITYTYRHMLISPNYTDKVKFTY